MAARPSLVGRDRELTTIEHVLTEAGTGVGRVVLVSGEPGIGKSSILRVARDAASRRGWRIGHGASAPVEGAWPYAPVVDALADLPAGARLDDVLDALAAAWSARRVADGTAERLGEEADDRGRPMFVAV